MMEYVYWVVGPRGKIERKWNNQEGFYLDQAAQILECSPDAVSGVFNGLEGYGEWGVLYDMASSRVPNRSALAFVERFGFDERDIRGKVLFCGRVGSRLTAIPYEIALRVDKWVQDLAKNH